MDIIDEVPVLELIDDPGHQIIDVAHVVAVVIVKVPACFYHVADADLIVILKSLGQLFPFGLGGGLLEADDLVVEAPAHDGDGRVEDQHDLVVPVHLQ